jgi:surface antigen
VRLAPLAALAMLAALLAAPSAAAARAASATFPGPNCGGGITACTPPLKYQGPGYVEHHPKIYLIFEGSEWNTNSTHKQVRTALINMFSHLAGTAYNNILTQYTDGNLATSPDDFVHNDVTYMGTDTVTGNVYPLFSMPDAAGIVDTEMTTQPAWYSAWSSDPNDQEFMVFPEGGTHYDGITINGVCGEQANEQSFAVNAPNRNYAVVKFGSDDGCAGTNPTTSQIVNEDTRIAAHEYAEGATDSIGNSWHTGDPSPGPGQAPPEVGDLCQGWSSATEPVTGAAVPYLWDNSSTANGTTTGACASARGEDNSSLAVCAAGAPVHTVYGTFQAAFDPIQAKLGCPAGEKLPFHGAWKQDFANDAAIYGASPGGPGAALYGAIYDDYRASFEVGSAGSIGVPTGSIHPVSSCNCDQEADFGNGKIFSDGTSANTGWLTGTVLSTWTAWGGPAGPLGLPTGDEGISGSTSLAIFQHGQILVENGQVDVVVNGHHVVGQARHLGNDYPWQTIGQFEHQDQGIDPWNEYYGQCDSFAAWKVYENLSNSAPQPPITPAPGWQPPSPGVSNVDQNTWGNAGDWLRSAPAHGWRVDNIPIPGSIAIWGNGHIGPVGHVAYVDDVYPDGSITIENYNLHGNGEYSKLHLPAGGGTDTSFGQTYQIPWPDGFAHIGDGPATNASGALLPPEPVISGTQYGYQYDPHVHLVGPGSPSSQFSTGNVWYTDTGHGELGNMLWTHTNGPTAVSTATWAPQGLKGSTCYRVDALVPDNYSDNPAAIYTVTDSGGTAYAAVNENNFTSNWAELGVFQTNSTGGGLTVKLDDRGNTGLYVAADAMRFWEQASCAARGVAEPVLGPSLSSGWTKDPGHGFTGSEWWSHTTGSTTSLGPTATWAPTALIPGACYEISAYVPDNYSDNNAARYQVQDQNYTSFWPQIEENSFTNQFASLGIFKAWGNGTLPVTLTSIGPSGQYVAADEVAYTLDPGCAGLGPPYNPRGQNSVIVGPGSGPSSFSTTDVWYSGIGHGYSDHQLWTHTNGATPVSTATWQASPLAAGTCYHVDVYVPINYYANNPQASYTLDTEVGVIGLQLNQATSNGWTHLADINTGAGTGAIVTLNDTGPAGTYTAADAIRFTPC